jgi:hypothetical protein
MKKNEWEIECEKLLFDFGRAVLGKNSGGMINKLMKERGISSARVILKMAAEKSEPREYVGAVLKEKLINHRAAVGEVIGRWYWNGSCWAERGDHHVKTAEA